MKLRDSIQNFKPYISGFQPNTSDKEVIKLNANENPYPPSPKIKELLQNIDIDKLRRYPFSDFSELRKTIAVLYNADESQVFCGNGSDEIISLIIRIFLSEGESILLPYPTYTVYKTYAEMQKLKCIEVNVNSDWQINVNELINKNVNIIFLVNPNAPTGILLSKDKIEFLLKNTKSLVIVDEAYIDFASDNSSVLNLINEYDNLIVLRTLSKSYSLCGIRVGMCFSNKEIINALFKFKDLGFDTVESQANFILCTPPSNISAKYLVDELQKYKIYVRYFNLPRLDNKLRISVGTLDEIDKLIFAILNIIRK